MTSYAQTWGDYFVDSAGPGDREADWGPTIIRTKTYAKPVFKCGEPAGPFCCCLRNA